ncbi:uncharacterized protein LOC107422559 isoform X1 [Ziziphus jujuba]|uniref:Uncharacterized protein LOC107422559 isoform X1 n=1 Tax=Ziziphus jujuba TaxID=326968 RepID=A0A6P3ZZ33_ZIZJJ|nr:uncharacterized protein LOC107422559 isoform X1 [Ziziphus jujuba]
MASLQTHHHHLQFHRCFSSLPSTLYYLRNRKLSQRFSAPSVSRKVRVLASRVNFRGKFCPCKAGTEIGKVSVEEEIERPPFDINLAVILAGFAFEAYTSPPENVGRREVDAADCKTVYLSESFVRDIYDGQLFVKLQKGFNLPAMDPWGTSDPYVVMQLDGQVVKSQIKWGTKEPTWNEDFTFNIKQLPNKNLQIAAWDANLVTPHKRMGNAGISLEHVFDGNSHEVVVELEGMGGGGMLQLEVKYKTFDEIEEEKKWWRVPFVSEFLRQKGFEAAFQKFVGSETVQAREFVEYAFGQLRSFNDAYLGKDKLLNSATTEGSGESNNLTLLTDISTQMEITVDDPSKGTSEDIGNNLEDFNRDYDGVGNGDAPVPVKKIGEEMQSDKHFWKNFANVINQNVVQKLDLPIMDKLKWDGYDLLNRIGLQSRRIAEAGYIESGLATPDGMDDDKDKENGSLAINTIQSSLPDIRKATEDLLRQTDSVLGALMVLTAAVSKSNREARLFGKGDSKQEDASNVKDGILKYSKRGELGSLQDGSLLDENKAKEMKALFSTAETAMEAWAMLATSLGHPSFIKSEFEKICFLDNSTTDTQVAIWRDSVRRRLVIAFRGTEQARWKDLRTDLMLVPAGLNPERIGGDFKQEVQVHSGFLSAYDSVRIRIISLIKLAIGYNLEDNADPLPKWHVYVTGHSLGGALATLLALELSSSQLAKRGAISVTMYNFGSPRVGNRRFAEVYNQKVKDSWRVVNHRDIIPTVPRLMGYCHVAQPVYLAAGDLRNALENLELMGDDYQGDVLGESTPDVLVSEFMKGEKELVEKILQTEINIFRSIRDGSALMQHMEDFYYITLLENVRSNYQTVARFNSNEGDSQQSTEI